MSKAKKPPVRGKAVTSIWPETLRLLERLRLLDFRTAPEEFHYLVTEEIKRRKEAAATTT